MSTGRRAAARLLHIRRQDKKLHDVKQRQRECSASCLSWESEPPAGRPLLDTPGCVQDPVCTKVTAKNAPRNSCLPPGGQLQYSALHISRWAKLKTRVLSNKCSSKMVYVTVLLVCHCLFTATFGPQVVTGCHTKGVETPSVFRTLQVTRTHIVEMLGLFCVHVFLKMFMAVYRQH